MSVLLFLVLNYFDDENNCPVTRECNVWSDLYDALWECAELSTDNDVYFIEPILFNSSLTTHPAAYFTEYALIQDIDKAIDFNIKTPYVFGDMTE